MIYVLCPQCRNEIEIVEHMTVCPLCRADIGMNVSNQLAAEECLSRLITNEDRERIEALLLDDKRKEAMHLIRRIRGKIDALVEIRVIKIIEQTTTNERLRQHATEMENKREAQEKFPLLTKCSACNKDISTKAESCPHCGQPTGVHVCPKCQSVNTKVISGASKATSIFLWGPFAANKVVSKFECKDCGHKW